MRKLYRKTERQTPDKIGSEKLTRASPQVSSKLNILQNCTFSLIQLSFSASVGNREVLYAPLPQYLMYLYSDELGNRIRVLRKAVLLNPMLVQ